MGVIRGEQQARFHGKLPIATSPPNRDRARLARAGVPNVRHFDGKGSGLLERVGAAVGNVVTLGAYQHPHDAAAYWKGTAAQLNPRHPAGFLNLAALAAGRSPLAANSLALGGAALTPKQHGPYQALGVGGARFNAANENLFTAAAMHAKATDVPTAAAFFKVHEGDLHTYLQQRFPQVEQELYSNKNPRAEQMSPRYRVNQLQSLLARVHETQQQAAGKAGALLAQEGLNVKRNAFRDLRDMRLAKSEMRAYKELNPGGTDEGRQFFPGTGIVGHGTQAPYFGRFADQKANAESNLFYGSHFFSDNTKLPSDYAGRQLGQEQTGMVTGVTPLEALQQLRAKLASSPEARRVGRNDPGSQLVTGRRLQRLRQQPDPSLPGTDRFTVDRLRPGDVARDPKLAEFLKPGAAPVWITRDTHDGAMVGLSFKQSFTENQVRNLNKRERDYQAQERTPADILEQMRQLGWHNQTKKYLRSKDYKQLQKTDPQAASDLYTLTFDRMNQQSVQQGRRILRDYLRDPLADPSKLSYTNKNYGLVYSRLESAPHVRLQQLDLRNALNPDHPLPLTDAAKLLRAYGEVAARNSDGHSADVIATGERLYGLPYDHPEVAAPLREAGRAWLKNRIAAGQFDRYRGRNPIRQLSDLEDVLATIAQDVGPRGLHFVMKRAGFGGIIHKGGIRVGNTGHNVGVVNFSKQIRDPWADPQALLAKHKQAGLKLADQLTTALKANGADPELADILAAGKELGIDLTPWLPKQALEQKPNLWEKIVEGRQKDISRLEHELERHLYHARDAVHDTHLDLRDMLQQLREFKHYGDPRSLAGYEESRRALRHGIGVRDPSLADIIKYREHAKKTNARLKLLYQRQARM